MFANNQWGTFLVVTLALLVVPGPSVVFAVTRTLERGRAAGLLSVAGLETGLLVHVAAAATGLSALAASSALALDALRYLGAGYLLLLAVRAFAPLSRPDQGHQGPVAVPSGWHLYREAMLVDVLNPKTVLFFLAFLPQFVDPADGSSAVHFLALGVCVVALAVATDSTYVIAVSGLAGRTRSRGLTRPRGTSPLIRRSSALVYTGLAVFALTR